MNPARLEVVARHGRARAGIVHTARGTFTTPCFMPVGTRGAVRLLDAADLDALGAEVVLANTYHLMLRPGAEVVAALGGIHRFTGRRGIMLTDSGGYQVFSLDPAVDDDGVTFRSTYDGSSHRLTAERAVAVQRLLGADIQMALDICPGLPAPDAVVRQAVERTLAWAARARTEHQRSAYQQPATADSKADQSLFGIVQGGVDRVLRAEAAERTVAIGFDGYGIGGLSVGEPHDEMMGALDAVTAVLPDDRPRYLMGVGDPRSILDAIASGVDMLDCVLPTRLGRHGSALTSEGRLSLRAARHATDDGPIDRACGCPVCARWSRGYLRHLFTVGEPTAGRLLSLHNLAWLLHLVGGARAAIAGGYFEEFRHKAGAPWQSQVVR